MTRGKKLLLMFAVFASMLLLTACGGSVLTTLEINDDFSGKRIINYAIAKSDFDESVSVSIEEVTKLLNEKNPGEFTIIPGQNANAYTYQFVIEFSSMKDYEEKVRKILDATSQKDKKMTYVVPDNPFIVGFLIDEDFTSGDLLKWVENAMLEKKYLSETNADYIISTQNEPKIIYQGKTYDTQSFGERVYYYAIEDSALQEMNIYTTINADDTIDRTISIAFSPYFLEREGKRDEVEAYLLERIPEEATYEWKSITVYELFEISIANASAEQVVELSNKFTGYDTNSFKISSKAEAKEGNMTSKKKMNVFLEEKNIEETLELRDFLYDNRYFYVPVLYHIDKGAQFIRGTLTEEEQSKEIWSNPFDDSYNNLFYSAAPIFDVKYSIGRGYHVNKADISVDLLNGEGYSKKIHLDFSDKIDENSFEQLKKRIESQAADTNIHLSKSARRDDGFSLEFTVKIHPGEDESAWEYFTEHALSLLTTIDYYENTFFKQSGIIADRVNLSVFTQSDIPEVEYRINSLGKVSYYEFFENPEPLMKNTLSPSEIHLRYEDVSYGELDNIGAVAEFERTKMMNVVIVGAGGVILLAILLIFLKKNGKKREVNTTSDGEYSTVRPTNAAPVNNQAVDAVTASHSAAPSNQETIFCSECGTKMTSGDVFCTNCGAKM